MLVPPACSPEVTGSGGCGAAETELAVAVFAVGFFLNDMFLSGLNLFVSTGMSMVTIRFGCSYFGRFAGDSFSAGFSAAISF